MLDDVCIDVSRSNACTYDCRYTFCIPEFSERVLFTFFYRFHFPMISHDSQYSVIEKSGFFELEIKIVETFVGISEWWFFCFSIRSIIRFMKRDTLKNHKICACLFFYSLQCLIVKIMIRCRIKDILFLMFKCFFADNFSESYSWKKCFLSQKIDIYCTDKYRCISLFAEEIR